MIRRSKPLARSTKPIPRKRAKPRRGPMRDPKYLAFLRKEGRCVAEIGDRVGMRFYPNHGLGKCDAAHGAVNGMGSKGPDNEAIPLCGPHHQEQHRIGRRAFEVKYGFEWQREAAAHYAAYLIWKEAQS